MNKQYNRLLSLGLAVVMTAGLIGTGPLHTVAEAISGGGSEDIVIRYPAGVSDNENDVATVVTGGTVRVDIISSGTFTEGVPPLKITAEQGIANEFKDQIMDHLKISGIGSNRRIEVKDSFANIMDGTGSAGLTITGNYAALLSDGRAVERFNTETLNQAGNPVTVPQSASGKVEIDGPALPIFEDSTLVLICTRSETATSAPAFTIGESRSTGIFAGYKNGASAAESSIKSIATTGIENVNLGTVQSSKNTLTIMLQGRETGSSSSDTTARYFKIDSSQLHTSYERGDDGQYTPLKYNNFIQKDTEIVINFFAPTSTQLMLNVLTPQEAVSRIADDIKAETGRPWKDATSGRFIKLAQYGDDGDHLDAITQVFTICGGIREFNENNAFTIEWKWETSDPDDPDKDAIIPPQTVTTQMMNVGLSRKYNNVEGKLVAKINRVPPQGSSGTAETTAEIKVVIYGTGQPASVEQYQHMTLGTSSWVTYPVSNRTPPQQVEMDVYDGMVPNFEKENDFPFRYRMRLKMGKDNAAAQYVKIDLDSEDYISVGYQVSGETALTALRSGDQINNPYADSPGMEGIVYLEVIAKAAGTVNMTITFYTRDPQGGNPNPALDPPAKKIMFIVKDTSPDDDATLKSIEIKDQSKEKIEYEFDPKLTEYRINVPYEIEKVNLTPSLNSNNQITADKFIAIKVDPAQETFTKEKVATGQTTPFVMLTPIEPVTVELTVTAENPNIKNTYKYIFYREQARDDSSLSAFQLLDEDGTTDYMTQAVQGKFELPNAATGFDAKIKDYIVNVPFKTTKLQVLATTTDAFISSITYDPALGSKNLLPFPPYNWLKLNDPEQDPTVLKITIVPQNENPDDQSVYTLTINHNPPSEDATLSALSVIDGTDDAKSFPYTPAFHGEMEEEDFYTVEPLPYLQEKIRISAKPTDPTTTMKLVYDGNEMDFSEKTPSKPIKVPYSEDGETPYVVQVVTTAENGNNITYPLHIVRNPPSTDASLTALAVADQDGGAVALDPDFNAETYTYTMSVPYETQKVAVTATTGYAGAALRIDGKKATSGEASSLIKLKYPGTTTIAVEVTAEDEKTVQKYTLKITRQKPSNDARLKSLAVTGIEEGTLKPIFVPDTLDYTANVAVGQKGVVITAIPNHKYATLKIDGKVVKNGEPSELIELMKVKQKILIEVTAQDGKTKKTYSITFTDMNKIELTDNANLKSLAVKPGVISPKFTPSATSYDVAVKEDVASVQIIPKPDDELAKVQVFFGSKEIGDWDGNFIQTIADGENAFTVTVTSPSGKVTKDYTILVHRNDEDNMQTLKPITAEDINFEQTGDVVLVDITKYTRVAADVFNTIKEEFPEKTIVFEGNDYSLEFKGEDLDTIVPHTEIFDFALRFTSPEENDIMNIADRYPENEGTRMVFVYFDHHGALPAPATFTVSLGSPYSEETLFWHYYNPERDRIDYYGNVKTNSKGTFAVKIDHLSTYIVADERIAGSENKAGATAASTGSLAATAGESLSDAAAASKPNPGTGVEGEGAQ